MIYNNYNLNSKYTHIKMYYRVVSKTNTISNKQILTITQQYQLKDAIYNKSILSIKVLNLRNSNINDQTIGILWTIPQQLQIICINLAQNFSFITDVAIDSICQCTNMKNLKEINLADNSITDQGLLRISKSTYMNKLQEIILYGNSNISSEGLIYFGQSPFLKNLKKLDLHDTSICDKGLGYFLKAENCSNLQYLDISMNTRKITDQTFKAIASSNYLKSLKYLKAEDCSITDDGIAYLASAQNCNKLELLSLNNSIKKKNNKITDISLQQLARSSQIKKLKTIELRNTDITSKGINTLSVSLGAENLQIIRLSHCVGIKDDAKRYLESIAEYRNLQKLYINSTMVSKEIAENMMSKYPNLNVIY